MLDSKYVQFRIICSLLRSIIVDAFKVDSVFINKEIVDSCNCSLLTDLLTNIIILVSRHVREELGLAVDLFLCTMKFKCELY